MSTQDPGSAPATLTSLPRIEDVPFTDHGYDPDRVREAFDAFRRHSRTLGPAAASTTTAATTANAT